MRLPDQAFLPRKIARFAFSACVALCWALPVFGATKGQQKGNVVVLLELFTPVNRGSSSDGSDRFPPSGQLRVPRVAPQHR
jgi:hypothetical protein